MDYKEIIDNLKVSTVKELMKRLEEIDQEIQKTDFEISKLNSIEFEI